MTSSTLFDELDGLRRQRRIPGLAAAVARDGQVHASTAFGVADPTGRPVTTDTPFEVASLTKPVSAVLSLQLVEAGKLDLDAPAVDFGVDKPALWARELQRRPAVTVRHLLSHTSGIPLVPIGPRRRPAPGSRYRYNGAAFGLLTGVVERLTDDSFADVVAERILAPCQMISSAPGPAADRERYGAVLGRAVRPIDRPSMLGRLLWAPKTLNAAAGLMATVLDYLRFDGALDRNELLQAASREAAWTPTIDSGGRELPYGLGFFTQVVGGRRIVWHYGNRPGFCSSLYVKVPDARWTFVAFANGDGLSRGFPLGRGDITSSPFARLALDHVHG